MKIVGIFGGNGYLGSEVVKICLQNNIPYILLPREIKRVEDSSLESINTIVDCGFPRDYYKKKVMNAYLNELSNRSKIINFQKVNYLYIGSFSSIAGQNSKYGKLKLKSEQLLESSGAIISRVGLVKCTSNPGGRYKELLMMVEKAPFILLPSPNWFPLFVTEIDCLRNEIRTFVNSGDVSNNSAIEIPLSAVIKEFGLEKRFIELNDMWSALLARVIKRLPLRRIEGIKSISHKARAN
jgi:hypothetical protein